MIFSNFFIPYLLVPAQLPLGLVHLLLLELEDDLEEVPHGDDDRARRLLRLDAEESVAVLRRPVDVAERPVVRHVLRDEADLVHRMVVQAVLKDRLIV